MVAMGIRRSDTGAMISATATPGATAPGVSLSEIVQDDGAFRAWYERTAPRVYAYLLSRCASEAVAEDLLQATYVEVVRRPATFDGRADPVPWLIGIARHQLARHYRQRHSRERWWPGGTIQEIEPVAESAEFQAARVGADIRTALQSLPVLQQAALVFRFLDGLSVRDVADHLGRSEAATQSLLRRARVQFAQAYRGESDVA
jgi:RNA polymerase sigma-70 factor (ECF subfamily)